MANSIVGVITAIGDTQNLTSKSGNAFKLRDLTLMVRRFDPNTGEPVTDNENTPQLTFMGDRCDELNNYAPGQMVTVYFDIQGRKYTDQAGITKIINDIRPYKIEAYQSRSVQPAPSAQPQSAPQSAPQQPYQPSAPVQQGYGQQQNYGQQGGQQYPQAPANPQGGYQPPF